MGATKLSYVQEAKKKKKTENKNEPLQKYLEVDKMGFVGAGYILVLSLGGRMTSVLIF